MRSPSQAGTRPWWSGRSALPERAVKGVSRGTNREHPTRGRLRREGRALAAGQSSATSACAVASSVTRPVSRPLREHRGQRRDLLPAAGDRHHAAAPAGAGPRASAPTARSQAAARRASKKCPSELPDPPGRRDLVHLAGLDHPRGDELRQRVDGADAHELQARRRGHLEDLAHAALLQQDLAVLDRIGEEGHRHHVGLRRGPLGQPVHHVVGIGGIVARQPAEQRDETHAPGVEPRQLLHRRRQRPAVPEADDPVLAALDLAPEKARARRSPSARSGRPASPRSGATSQNSSPKRADELLLEVDAFDDVAVDRHLDRPVGDGAGDQPVRLDRGDAQPLGDRRLGHPAGIVQPDRPDRERAVVGTAEASRTIRPAPRLTASAPQAAQIPRAGVDPGRPEGDALGDLRDHLPVVGLALLERQLEANLVVHARPPPRKPRAAAPAGCCPSR